MLRHLTAIGLVMGFTAPVPAAEPTHETIEAVVRELLEREPELVINAIEQFRAQQEVLRAAAAEAAIVEQRAALESAKHPSVGPADAAVTVVEFFDYRCGFCRRMLQPMAKLKEAHDDVRIVYVDFPVLGPDSRRAAQASLAAWLQRPDEYFAFHGALMTANDLSAPAIVELAKAHGFDTDQLLSDMQSDVVRERLEANYALAQAIGINGTPAFVVGDTLLPGAVPVERLEALIADARRS